MRCTRCDRIAVPQAVGITPEGLVVFGWCLDCLAEENCALVEVAGAGIATPPRPLPPRPAHRPRQEAQPQARRLVLKLIAGMMGVWAVVLLGLGAIRFLWPAPAPANPLGNGTAWFLTAGGAFMAVCSLAMAAALFWSEGGRRLRHGRHGERGGRQEIKL
jgi:hypothetical protein